ncbi:cyclic AMP-dependent transcription factor ATF-2-like isoform X3 [Asterias amurensis]|uniref:cyclic AMP-dependent transcription factor ATF-2-like isoform X3 n=1 Tax=Asterias amurensis TaxID=7602 RepID=UPI003AB50C2C
MMGDSGKPFACTELGCNQRFVNEDHLEVHRRKHEMSLGLRDFKSLDTPVIADQTPTPTRFLKNCEEVGLFNEPHNPFDAMFRKASEHGGPDSIGTSSSKTPQEESLEIELTDSPDNTMEESAQQAVSSTTTEDTHQLEETIGTEELSEDNMVSVEVEVSNATPASQTVVPISLQGTPVTVSGNTLTRLSNNYRGQALGICQSFATPILLRLPNGQTIPVVPPSVANPSAPIPVAMSAVPQVSVMVTKPVEAPPLDSNLVKQKLKNTLLTCQSQGNMGVMTQAVDVVTRQQAGVLTRDSLASLGDLQDLSPNSPLNKRKRRSSDMSTDEKRERFLERNRAAATRCRNKRKVWISSLEQKADDLNSTNNVLSSEVTKLREEVAQLKQLLLAHNDCPVTIMQRQTHASILAAAVQNQSANEDIAQTSTSNQHQAEDDGQQLPR